MFFPVRLQRDEGSDGPGSQDREERIKINGPPADRKMFIAVAAIIVGVDFSQKVTEGFDPLEQRRL